MKYMKRIYWNFKYCDYPLWYNLTWGLIVNTKWYFHLYYKHTKRHKDEIKRVKDGVLKRRKEIIGK